MLRKVIRYTSITVCLLLTAALLLTGVFLLIEEKVKQAVMKEINASLTVPLKTGGGIELSLWKHFPDVAFSMKQIEIDDRLGSKTPLLRLEEFSLLMNLPSVFGNRIEVSKILLRQGEANIRVLPNGKNNYDILRRNRSSDSPINVRLQKALLSKLKVSYNDASGKVMANFHVTDLKLKGDFGNRQFALATEGRIMLSRISVPEWSVEPNKEMALNATLDVNHEKQLLKIEECRLVIHGNTFVVHGMAVYGTKRQANFTARCEGNDLQHLLHLLPQQLSDKLLNATGNGAYRIDASITGNGSRPPVIAIDASLTNGRLKLKGLRDEISALNTEVMFRTDAYGNRLHIKSFSASMNDDVLRASLLLRNLPEADFEFSANGTLHLPVLQQFIPDSVMSRMEGIIAFEGFSLTGNLRDFDAPVNRLKGSGSFALNDVGFKAGGVEYHRINGKLVRDYDLFRTHELSASFLGCRSSFTGTIGNLLPFIHNLVEKRQADGIELKVDGRLDVDELDLEQLIAGYGGNSPKAGNPNQPKLTVHEVLQMRGTLRMAVKNLKYRKLNAAEVTGWATLSPAVLQINQLSAKTMDGFVTANGRFEFSPRNNLLIDAQLRLTELDIRQLFEEAENFGQQALTANHLKGKLNSDVSLHVVLKDMKKLDESSLKAVVDVSILNGELIRFEPLKAASKFIRIEELEHIRFQDIHNQLMISDRKIMMPGMEINSSALNLIISGTHDFDNRVDYHLKINLHRLLAQKFRRSHQREDWADDDPYGGLNLLLWMRGPLSKPDISLDKKAVKAKIADDMKAEREELKQLFEKSIPKRSAAAEEKGEGKYFELNEEPVFLELENSPR